CTAYGKEFSTCQAHGIDITTFIIVGMYWAKIALPIVWFISLLSKTSYDVGSSVGVGCK
ncbi:MAG: hypothetical protein QG672_1028, partial [Pseudomonadota bacterium]|nr:hypothetical protein [Pseudomonadota bacterium]